MVGIQQAEAIRGICGGETNVTDDQFRKLITPNQRSQTVLVKGYTEVPTAQREKQKYLTNDTSAEIINNFRKRK